MELIVGTNSYMTLEEADNIVVNTFTSISKERKFWNSLEANDKSILVAEYTSKIDNIINECGIGAKLDEGQTLAFPRYNYNLEQEINIDNEFKKGILKLIIIENIYANTEIQTMREQGVIEKKIKDASIKFSDTDSSKTKSTICGVDANIFKDYFMKYTILVG